MKKNNKISKKSYIWRPRQSDKINNVIFIHNLKHSLTTIKWSLKMILSEDFGKISDELKDIIKKNIEENEKLIFLANNILSGEPIQEAKNFLNKDLYNTEQIVDEVIESNETKIKEKKIQLELLKPEKMIEAFLDKEKIKIVIQNILDNAIRYTPKGGKIIISMAKNNGDLEIKIQDSGIGIPKNQKEKLFTKFFRGANAAKINSDGSGLGLFIVKNIIDAHGGRIWFDSEENKGSAFYFTLPIKKM